MLVAYLQEMPSGVGGFSKGPMGSLLAQILTPIPISARTMGPRELNCGCILWVRIPQSWTHHALWWSLGGGFHWEKMVVYLTFWGSNPESWKDHLGRQFLSFCFLLAVFSVPPNGDFWSSVDLLVRFSGPCFLFLKPLEFVALSQINRKRRAKVFKRDLRSSTGDVSDTFNKF